MFPLEDINLPSIVVRKSDVLDNAVQSLMLDHDIMCKQVVWRERQYLENTVVVIERKDALELSVGIIKCMLVRNDILLFVVKRCKMVQTYLKVFKSRYIEENVTLIDARSLPDTYPLMMRGLEQNFFIIPHHHVS